jgi:hypothetical protein
MCVHASIRTSRALVRQPAHSQLPVARKLSLTLSEPNRQYSSWILGDLPASSFTRCFGGLALPILRPDPDRFFLVHNVQGLQRTAVNGIAWRPACTGKATHCFERTGGTLWLRCTRRLGHWRVVGGTRLRLILIIGHNLTVSLYSFFEFLADVAGRLLRHGASFEKEDRECQTDCAKTSHPHQTREMDIFLQS